MELEEEEEYKEKQEDNHPRGASGPGDIKNPFLKVKASVVQVVPKNIYIFLVHHVFQ